MGGDLYKPPFSLRPATREEAKAIRLLINQVGINPTGLDWRRFLLAVDPEDQMIGCGQVKPHGDGTHELASIAVVPGWRDRGVARLIIETLIEQNPGRLYLICRSSLEPFYEKFGFLTVPIEEMPPYFRRIMRLLGVFRSLGAARQGICVMRRGDEV